MAVLVSYASGNINAAATWATTSTYSGARSSNATALGTTTTSSNTPSFILNDTVDAVALLVSRVNTTPTGTATVELYNMNTASVSGTCTINTSDIQVSDGSNAGWYVFKFASSVAGGGSTYTVRPYTSASNQVWLWRNSATTSDWSKFLRTTTTQAPVGGDTLIVAGELTGAGTGTTIAVTVDYECPLAFASNILNTNEVYPAISVNRRGILQFSTTANSTLISSGHLNVYAGGTLWMGNTSTAIPSTATANLYFNVATNSGYGLNVFGGGTFISQGSPRTSGKSVVVTKLTANASVNAQTLTVATDTGWLSGDQIAIASTSRTYTEYDGDRVLSSNATASTLTLVANTTYAHLGDTANELQAHVILLNRNVIVRGTSNAFNALVVLTDHANVNCAWTEFRYVGSDTDGSRGICISQKLSTQTFQTNTSLNYCSVRETRSHGIEVFKYATNSTIAITNTSVYKFGDSLASGWSPGIQILNGISDAGANVVVDQVTLLGSRTGPGLYFRISEILSGEASVTNKFIPQVTNVVATSIGASGILLDVYGYGFVGGTYNNWECYSTAGSGIELSGGRSIGGTIETTKSWRNADNGIYMYGAYHNLTFKNFSVIGNANNTQTSLNIRVTSESASVTFQNGRIFGDATYATRYGFGATNGIRVASQFRFEGCDFGNTTNSVLAAHTISDLQLEYSGGGAAKSYDMVFDHCLFGANALPTRWQSADAVLRFQKYNRTTGDDRVYHKAGSLYRQNTVSVTGSAIELRPANSWVQMSTSMDVRGKGFQVAALSGVAVTGNVSVRVDNTYNGTSPQVLVLTNYAAGINTEMVLNTHSAAANTWQSLNFSVTPTSNGILEFIVSCKANTGSVFIDNWKIGE